jgi:hypothetical protein
MTFEQTITDMGILSNEVYNNKYLEYKVVDGKKEYANAFITTANGTYTIIDSEDTLNSMQALLLKAPDGKFVIAFRGTQEPIITKGMDVAVKIDTFDFQKYGLINGKVKHIADDAIEDEKLGPVYEIAITPTNTTLKVEGKQLPITAGMSVTVELKVGKRRVIEFFIYPMIKYLDEGLSVR